MRRGLLVLLLLGLPTWAWAVDIQYHHPIPGDGRVSAVSDAPLGSVTGYGLETLTGVTAADLVWPVPTGQPANTSCGIGQAHWTQITTPGSVTAAGGGMAVRPGLLLFKTTSSLLPGCHEVSSWQTLRSLVESTVITAVQNYDALVLTLNALNVMAQVRCPGATGGVTCDSVRASMATLNSTYPTAAQLNTFLAQVVTLRADALQFKTANGW
jgi:hypothetical protein